LTPCWAFTISLTAPPDGQDSKDGTFFFLGPVYPTEIVYSFSDGGDYVFDGYVLGTPFGGACYSLRGSFSCEGKGSRSGSFTYGNGFTDVSIFGYLSGGPQGASATITASPAYTAAKPGQYCETAEGYFGYCGPPPPFCEFTGNCGADKDNSQIAGANLLPVSQLDVPVVQEHGLTDFVWSNAASEEPPVNQTPFKAAYSFESMHIPFTHFIIPEALPGGDSEFQIIAGDFQSFPLQAGVAFDFTPHFADGVTAFLLTGFDAAEGLLAGEPFPYTHGYRFAEEGTTFVTHGPFTPGDFTMGGLVDEGDLAIWQASYGIDDRGDADGDGDTAGRDFLIWQRNLVVGDLAERQDSYGAESCTTTSVPEPSSILLLSVNFVLTLRRSIIA
jgi:hypothetical protein